MTLQVGVKVVLENADGKILVLLRSGKYETAEGTWDVPGGRIDSASFLLDNLAREVDEETKLTLTSEPVLVGAQDIFFKNNQDEDIHIVRLTYVAHTSGEPVLDGTEHTEFRWVSFEELTKLAKLDPYLKMLIDNSSITTASWI